MLSVTEWRKRILEYFAARGNHIYRASTQEKIFQNFGSHIDANTYIAFATLLQSNLIENITSGKKTFYTLNIEKLEEVRRIIVEESDEEKCEIIQPQESEFDGLTLVFTSATERKQPRQGGYYYCVKKNDHSYWIVLLKTKILGNANRIKMGSFNDAQSRISRIWNAILVTSNEKKDGKFIRKDIEDLEPKACGNNRQPSKAAFDIFVKTGLIRIVERKGHSPVYVRTGEKPSISNLDVIFTEQKLNGREIIAK